MLYLFILIIRWTRLGGFESQSLHPKYSGENVTIVKPLWNWGRFPSPKSCTWMNKASLEYFYP